jgi:formylglycine-generating enzyme required for sulfatase activity
MDRSSISTMLLLASLVLGTIPVASAAKKKPVTDDRGVKVAAKSGNSLKRIALVIGNGAYLHSDSLPKLVNPVNDADDIAAALRRFGFDVMEKKNLTREEMDETISDFGRRIANSDVALFYYAGHGLQVKGQNYLVPVDANIDSEAIVPHRAVSVNQLLDEMESSRSRVNIVMLDACRNNPISGKFRSGATRGLAPPAAMPEGTVIVYATGPGKVAADGSGRNGVFTAGLLRAFRGNDLTLGGVLYAASKQVQEATGQLQTPFVNGPTTLQREFSFVLPSEMTNLQPAPVPVEPVAPVVATPVATRPTTAGRGFTDPTLGTAFVGIMGGCYEMGDTFGVGRDNEKPPHEVCVSDFALAKYDVTVGEFRKFTVATGYRTEAEKASGCAVWNGKEWAYDTSKNWQSPGFDQDDGHPVVCVSWNDTQEFSRWLGKESGKAYRLPTEAEWEYAARSGGKKEKYAGFSDAGRLSKYANFCDANCEMTWKTAAQDDGYRNTSPVGRYLPNDLGLYDMTGNVWQWCGDWYGENYYRDSLRSNPQGPTSGSYRVIRGGSWGNDPAGVRASFRFDFAPGLRNNILGFRLVSPAVR